MQQSSSTVGELVLAIARKEANRAGREVANPGLYAPDDMIDISIDYATHLTGSAAGRQLSKLVSNHLNVDHDSLIVEITAVTISRLVSRYLRGNIITRERVEHVLQWFQQKWNSVFHPERNATLGDEFLRAAKEYHDHHHASHRARKYHGIDNYFVDITTCLVGSHSGRMLTHRVGHATGSDDLRVNSQIASATIAGFVAQYLENHVITLENVDRTFDWVINNWNKTLA